MNRHVRTVLAVVTGLVTTVAMTLIATAQDSTTGTVNIGDAPIRSISVNPGSFDFDSCDSGGGTMSFPHDLCAGSTNLFVTNGDVPSTVHVRATDLQGSAGGTPWSLCFETCVIDDQIVTGVDEALLGLFDAVNFGFTWQVLNADQCHGYWDPDSGEFGDCAAAANQQVELQSGLWGPEATTNSSPSFATVITWSALP